MIKGANPINFAKVSKMPSDELDAVLHPAASQCAKFAVPKHKLKERASTEVVSVLEVDLAKNGFQLHRAAEDRPGVFRMKPSRPQFAQLADSRVWIGQVSNCPHNQIITIT